MKVSKLHNMLENKCYGVKNFFGKVRAIGEMWRGGWGEVYTQFFTVQSE